MRTLDVVLWTVGFGLLAGLGYLIWSYARGLRESPRELAILFLAKVTEYSAYSAMNMTFVLFLSSDCGLSDVAAGTFVGVWSMVLTLCTILVGAVVDAVGIKRTLIVGAVSLIVARLFLPFVTNIAAVSILGFLPAAIGCAMLVPVLSVGIKRYTTKEGAALGFALFYTLMNVGYAFGYYLFDKLRELFGEHAMVTTPIAGVSMSTYQIIFLATLALTIPVLLGFLLMRDGVRMTEDAGVVVDPPALVEAERGVLGAFAATVAKAAADTGRIFRQAVGAKAFWVYIFMLSLLVPVRLVFYHFHYTWPKYGIRLLGEGAKVGNIYGVLNPMLIVFLVPLFGALTRKISSYKVMLAGSTLSAASVFIAALPARWFAWLTDTWVGEIVYSAWLHVPLDRQNPTYFVMILCIFCFTVGEALWSPRLLQFTAEIAPKGREGSYIALSYLPFFLAKLIAGPMSGLLLANYVPAGAESYPHHHLLWVWIGGMAALTPVGLLAFYRLFHQAEVEAGTAR
jgi:dipeptide/tripeptide permease